MSFLSALKSIRITRGITTSTLAEISGIAVARLRLLETTRDHFRHEPWLDEAVACARSLGVSGILPLMGADSLSSVDTPFSPVDPLTLWRSNARLPLSDACRIARAFGFSDPEQLTHIDTFRQIWDVVSATERLAGRVGGHCPWCAAHVALGEPHHHRCLADAMLAPRERFRKGSMTHTLPRPHVPGAAKRASSPGRGVRTFRERLGLTQEQFGNAINTGSNYVSQIERGRINLTLSKARTIVLVFGGDVSELYHDPGRPPERVDH